MNASAERSKRRRNYVINRRMQFNLVASLLSAILIASLAVTLVASMWLWARSSLGENKYNEYITIERRVPNPEQTGGYKTLSITGVRRWHIILPVLVLNNLAIMLTMTVVGILHTHRIAGPAYKMGRVISAYLDGEPREKIVLREKDQLGALATSINRLLLRIEAEEQQKNVHDNPSQEKNGN